LEHGKILTQTSQIGSLMCASEMFFKDEPDADFIGWAGEDLHISPFHLDRPTNGREATIQNP